MPHTTPLTIHELLALQEQGMILTDDEAARVDQQRRDDIAHPETERYRHPWQGEQT